MGYALLGQQCQCANQGGMVLLARKTRCHDHPRLALRPGHQTFSGKRSRLIHWEWPRNGRRGKPVRSGACAHPWKPQRWRPCGVRATAPAPNAIACGARASCAPHAQGAGCRPADLRRTAPQVLAKAVGHQNVGASFKRDSAQRPHRGGMCPPRHHAHVQPLRLECLDACGSVLRLRRNTNSTSMEPVRRAARAQVYGHLRGPREPTGHEMQYAQSFSCSHAPPAQESA